MSSLTKEQIKERIRRNQDRIGALSIDNTKSGWEKANLKVYHANRILRWQARLMEKEVVVI